MADRYTIILQGTTDDPDALRELAAGFADIAKEHGPVRASVRLEGEHDVSPTQKAEGDARTSLDALAVTAAAVADKRVQEARDREAEAQAEAAQAESDRVAAEIAAAQAEAARLVAAAE